MFESLSTCNLLGFSRQRAHAPPMASSRKWRVEWGKITGGEILMSEHGIKRVAFQILTALARLIRAMFLGFEAFTKRIFNTQAPDRSNRISSAIVLAILFFAIGGALWAIVSWAVETTIEMRETAKAKLISPAERLARARAACGTGSKCLDMNEAAFQISNIPDSAPERNEASKLLLAIHAQVDQENEGAKRNAASVPSESSDSPQDESWAKAQRNFQGHAHDDFQCADSTEKQPIVSFDGGLFWWKDDGRCAARMQKKRDEDAEALSYWSTTVRVNTDMDSFWLPDEERTCQTSPDEKGRVATVTCDATPHTTHNIPVKFWGGVDRNTVSSWKCRREKDLFSDEFVCRAID